MRPGVMINGSCLSLFWPMPWTATAVAATLPSLYGGLAAVAIRIDPTYFVLYLRASVLYTSLASSLAFLSLFTGNRINCVILLLTRLASKKKWSTFFLTRSSLIWKCGGLDKNVFLLLCLLQSFSWFANPLAFGQATSQSWNILLGV